MAGESVALIGAASALAGVVVTGTFTLLKGRQERLDKSAERDEQRRIMHREARRSAYVEFLNASHVAERKLHELKKIYPAARPDDPPAPAMEDLEAAIIALREAGSTVSVEGPAEMHMLADALVATYWDVFIQYARLFRSHHGESNYLFTYASPERDAAAQAMAGAQLDFELAARKFVGGDAPGWT
jgi:hypothetical protein